MKFTRLKLHGFKSFCDQTELYFEPGLTGVIGPNGCGKSNLVEALRWVMGESSYKAMRAGGMDDVIFSGSGNRPARNSAEVTVVLDNSDRTAPAALNNSDVLEVTRRIEREEGSVYRVNGREVRARDVQLLFADASTGAHSPALVRQGQIGELIAAKPTQRRALLEEAAGISGLHSRRHEAELRLRAAEQNLERVDDIIGQVEQQLEQLRRQARLATRYRGLSGEIRKAEATLFHIRWVNARVAEREAEALKGKMVVEVGDTMHLERRAAGKLEELREALTPLRAREASASAALQRLTIAAEQIEAEARRARERVAELEARQTQIGADAARERSLAEECDAALARMSDESQSLVAEREGEAAALEEARTAMSIAQAAVGDAENASLTAGDALAQARARRAQLRRGIEDATQRVARLTQQINEVASEAEALRTRVESDDSVNQKRAALESAQAALAKAEQTAIAAEGAAGLAQAALDATRPQMTEVEASLARLDAEASTLNKLLNANSSLWPAIADSLKVDAGYETALGAALGDDLEASGDDGAPVHWSKGADDWNDAALPAGAAPLSQFVTGNALLSRRLAQIGVVADRTVGDRLVRELQAGQRLVTVEGDFWRWDGFASAADAPSAAAQRLAQRNRLVDLDDEIRQLRRDRDGLKADAAEKTDALVSSRDAERSAREAWRAAQHGVGAAQGELDRAQKALGDVATRQSALEEAATRLKSSLGEAEGVLREHEASLAGEEDETALAQAAEAAQGQLAAHRRALDDARLRFTSFDGAANRREQRLKQIAGESADWMRRLEGARLQLGNLEQRQTEIARELAESAASPDSLAAKREALSGEIEAARLAHKMAADALAVGEGQERELNQASKIAAEALANARSELARLEERHSGLIAQRMQLERIIVDSLGIEAAQTAQAAGLRPEEALPAETPTEQKLERLKAERERLGGVNLSAEKEAEETREKLELMTKDRDELIEAIAKLRTGIQNLNREGRARLSEAFERVNGHFQELFTSLFGGGTAELQFVESDDPLEAGLEIIAKPPGKKPQTMTLLSGGEQALTAMSLIFAVFLTNPAPICVLDEVDAPLDDANVDRFCNLLDSMRKRTDTRFLVITHHPVTMSRVDRLFGVTMAERGVSQLVSVDLTGAQEVREAS